MAKFSLSRFNWKIVALLLPICGLWGWLAQSGRLQTVEHLLLDMRFRYRGDIKAPVKVFYVDLDSYGIQRIGERPWNRARFAEAAQAVFEHGGAKAVAFDFVFSDFGRSELVNQEEARKGNIVLARLTRKYPNLVLAAQYTGGEASTQEGRREFPLIRRGYVDAKKNDIPELPQYPIVAPGAATTIGLIDIDYDFGRSQVPRWAPLFAESPLTVFWHMAVQLACVELGVPPSSARRAGNYVEIVSPADGTVLRRIPLTAQQLLEINWFSHWDDQTYNPRSSMADVLTANGMMTSEKPEEKAEAAAYFTRFKDAIVLIGPVDPLLQDLAPTPFDQDPVPKVGGHGNLLKTIIAERYLKRPAEWVMWACNIAITLMVTALVVSGGARSVFTKVLALLILSGFVMVSLHQFAEHDVILPMTAPLGAALTAGFLGTIWQLVSEQKQKGRIKTMFGTYLAPALVTKMVDSGEDPTLGGVEEQITAYFSDIQSFSSFSEKLTPPRLVGLMNEYLTACTDIVQAEGGTLDKYIGDAVVAIYGAPLALPDHGYRACVAALRVHARIAELREKWKNEKDKEWPEIVVNMQTRIGLNSGPAVVGNMGSTSRFSYTMMGDNVNLAARMESGAKSWGVYSMCAEATKLECEKHGGDRVIFRLLGKIVVKGRTTAVPVYEIAALKEMVTPTALECYRIFAEGLARYYARDWEGALALFRQSAELEPNQPGKTPGVQSNPSLVYLERVVPEAMEEPPSADWDGRYIMKEK